MVELHILADGFIHNMLAEILNGRKQLLCHFIIYISIGYHVHDSINAVLFLVCGLRFQTNFRFLVQAILNRCGIVRYQRKVFIQCGRNQPLCDIVIHPAIREEKRAAFCLQWLKQQGAEDAYIDEALNVVLPIGCTGEKPISVFMAHSDVVFPDTTSLPLKIENGRILCPGIGDDTANVVALMMAAKYILEHNLIPQDQGILLVVNSGEEGLGNLKGSRTIMTDFGSRIREFVSFDGTCRSAVTKAVGSRRFEINASTQGGHSYADFGNTNAIAVPSELITRLYQIKVPELGKTTYNVGIIQGGTSVNTNAQKAQMLYEFRSDERSALGIMQNHFDEAISQFRRRGYDLSVALVGDRPCSGDVDISAMEALSRRVQDAVYRHFGLEIPLRSGSTDCNIPLSMGISAICIGCYEGGGAHAREEYVEVDSLLPGLKLALELILYHF